MKTNQILVGDNLSIMRTMGNEVVDLIYLDPPFNSNQNYAAPIGSEAAGASFKDTWANVVVHDVEHNKLDERLRTLHEVIESIQLIHSKSMMNYLIMMSARLIEMKRILKESGSIYLHCDPTASHYLKLVMDTLFREENFRNEIIWKRTGASSSAARQFGRIHDTILFYAKSENTIWNKQYGPHDEKYLKTSYNYRDEHGIHRMDTLLTWQSKGSGEGAKPWRGINPADFNKDWNAPKTGEYAKYIEEYFIPGYTKIESIHARLDALDDAGLIHWPKQGKQPEFKRYLAGSPGRLCQDIITDINNVGSSKEKTGYPTQKPLALLERIIKASSNPDDVVFDPFCGCATTLVAAERLQRRWVGIDISEKAVEIAKTRLTKKSKTGQLLLF